MSPEAYEFGILFTVGAPVVSIVTVATAFRKGGMDMLRRQLRFEIRFTPAIVAATWAIGRLF